MRYARQHMRSPPLTLKPDETMPSPRENEPLWTAARRFINWSDRLLQARSWSNSKPLFHYTTVAALEGILSSRSLWLTRLQEQKDPTELSFGLDLYQQIVAENAADASPSRIHAAFFDELRKIDKPTFATHFDCHVACFAPHGEDFDLWERYGDRGRGVAIGISPAFFAVSDPNPNEPYWFVQPVTYGRLAPAHEMRKVIQIASIALGEMAPLIHSNADFHYAINVMSQHVVAGHILPACMLAKGDDFHPEIEIRALAPRPRQPTDPRQQHVVVPMDPKTVIERVLLGQNADHSKIRDLISSSAPSAAIEVAQYSRGLDGSA